ncbi:GPR/FUN34 family protein [Penicillium maclennaniae]|uniref:GPR/FUN34 family protein n=1 Tax=Penicillium maclennaniae TaxID=1343394 RepID=UPI00253FBE5E|nr:GPR/FUN34 family protein [Penicillium maclennaniae]KAJ5667870.1 GPR/FUN34 family protein [Penicillium maclennaniae]
MSPSESVPTTEIDPSNLEAGVENQDTLDQEATQNRDYVHSVQSVDYGRFGPLARVKTSGTLYPPFAGEFQPGAFRPGPVEQRKIGNPAPLGLCGFALTTFLLGCINMKARLLSGMWEMAVGNTFGATALASYGGFWISLAITFTPGGFEIASELIKTDNGSMGMFYDSLGLYLMGWFIFTFLMLLCTVKSTVVFFSLFFSVDLSFLLLALGYLVRDSAGDPSQKILTAGGFFALLAAFLAWWAALAGIADTSNSFFIIPVWHFPWSDKGKKSRRSEG